MLMWEDLEMLARAERQPIDELMRLADRTPDDARIVLRLARAAVRENRLTEALAIYDRAEALGSDQAHEERHLVAARVGDFPGSSDRLLA